MKVNGNEMAITLRRGANLTALPFCNETLRQVNDFYTLPSTVDKKKPAVYIRNKSQIEGCLVSRLSFENISELFEILSNHIQDDDSELFDLLVNRKTEKDAYRNLRALSFELRGNNGAAFYLRVDVTETRKSFIDVWEYSIPDIRFNPDEKTFLFDGHNIFYVKNGKAFTIPLVYRFTLNGSLNDCRKYVLNLYFPFTDEFFPKNVSLEKLVIPLSVADGIYLELNNLKPLSDETSTDCADAVLCKQGFNVTGLIKLIIKTRTQYREIEI